MASSSDRFRLVVAGRIAHAAADIIRARFGDAAAIHAFGDNTAVDLVADQSSLRTLATLLWDLGHDLVEISQISSATRALSASQSHTAAGP